MKITCYDARRIYTCYHEAKKILAGEIPSPRMALIYPSRVCNHSCYYCSDRWGNKKINGFMPKDKLMALPRQLKDLGAESCELCGGGEPLLHPDIEEFIDAGISAGLKMASLTNGTKIKGALMEKIVNNFSYIRVSIDTFDSSVYNQIRRPKNTEAELDKVLANIRGAIAYRNKVKTGIQIGVRLSMDKNNIHEIVDSVKQARELGCDSIQIKVARNSDEGELPEVLVNEGKKQLEIAAKKVKGIVILGSLDKYKIDHRCWLSPCHIFIDTTGDARICCYYQFREQEHTYGNVFKEPLKDVWFGEKHKELISKIKPEECNKWDCKYFVYNIIMKEALVNDKAQWQFV